MARRRRGNNCSIHTRNPEDRRLGPRKLDRFQIPPKNFGHERRKLKTGKFRKRGPKREVSGIAYLAPFSISSYYGNEMMHGHAQKLRLLQNYVNTLLSIRYEVHKGPAGARLQA